MVVHQENIVLYRTLGYSGTLPLHNQPGILHHVRRLHLAVHFLAVRRNKLCFADAGAIRVDNEATRAHLYRNAIVKYCTRQPGAVNILKIIVTSKIILPNRPCCLLACDEKQGGNNYLYRFISHGSLPGSFNAGTIPVGRGCYFASVPATSAG